MNNIEKENGIKSDHQFTERYELLPQFHYLCSYAPEIFENNIDGCITTTVDYGLFWSDKVNYKWKDDQDCEYQFFDRRCFADTKTDEMLDNSDLYPAIVVVDRKRNDNMTLYSQTKEDIRVFEYR